MEQKSALNQVLKQRKKSIFSKYFWWILALLFIVIIAWFVLRPSEKSAPKFQFEPVTRGDLTITVLATGTIQPTQTVEIGSELSGTIAQVLVQENDRVNKGQLLAKIDTAKLQDSVARSRAALKIAEATVAQHKASLKLAEIQLHRLKQLADLSAGKMPAKIELDQAQAEFSRAEANVQSAEANVIQVKAGLQTELTNLTKADIRAPVSGVILMRKVEAGQTVVASMSAPVLFTIAEDLSKMELQVRVDEADIAQLKEGQKAKFTVAAWPNKSFSAEVSRISLGATLTDNVVTYKTVLSLDNKALLLRPGMTASANIMTQERKNALLIPNAALRFNPKKAANGKERNSVMSTLLPRRPPDEKKTKNIKEQGSGTVWIIKNQQAEPIEVKLGLSNGKQTEVLSTNLSPNLELITDFAEKEK